MAKTDDQSASPFFGTTQEDSPAMPAPGLNQSGGPQPYANRIETEEEPEQVGGEIAVDVHETDDSIIIVSPIAGVNPENVEISADDESVTISGERQAEHTARSKNTIMQEIYWGKFSRTITLPAAAEVDKAKATFKHGVLTVAIPKTGKAKKRTIKVKTVE